MQSALCTPVRIRHPRRPRRAVHGSLFTEARRSRVLGTSPVQSSKKFGSENSGSLAIGKMRREPSWCTLTLEETSTLGGLYDCREYPHPGRPGHHRADSRAVGDLTQLGEVGRAL